MKTFDAVIIGAGIAGLQCARLLGARGVKVLLVDRKTDLSKGVHTTGIFVRKTLEDFDFPMGTLGKPVRNVTLYSPGLKAISLESDHDEFRVGKMGKLYEALLREAEDNGVLFSGGTSYLGAHASPGAQASPPAMSAEREQTSDGQISRSPDAGAPVIVTLKKSGRIYQIKTKVLIGADGARSRVARDLNLDENKEWIVGYEEVFHVSNTSGEPHLHCFLDAELAPGYLAWVADDTEEIHIGVGGYASDFDPRAALKSFKEKVRFENFMTSRGKDFRAPFETRGGRIPVGGVLGRIACERGLLVGDAAGAVSPLTAGGLDPAMRLSRFAADIVWERLQTNDPRVLLEYSGELFRARFVSRLWMRRVIKTFTNQNLLELGFKFLRGRIGQKFARHVFFGRGSFPDITWSADILSAAGAKKPQTLK